MILLKKSHYVQLEGNYDWKKTIHFRLIVFSIMLDDDLDLNEYVRTIWNQLNLKFVYKKIDRCILDPPI